jgi:hypothetical protein
MHKTSVTIVLKVKYGVSWIVAQSFFQSEIYNLHLLSHKNDITSERRNLKVICTYISLSSAAAEQNHKIGSVYILHTSEVTARR